MSILFDLFSTDIAQRIGWTLVHSLWQFTLLAGVVQIGLILLRNRTAESRYVLACVGLTWMLVASLITFWSPLAVNEVTKQTKEGQVAIASDEIPVTSQAGGLELPPEIRAEAVSPTEINPLADAAAANTLPTAPITDTLPKSQPVWHAAIFTPCLPWITLGWLTGVLLFSLRQAGGWLGVQRLRHVGISPVTLDVVELAERLRSRMKITRPVPLWHSTRVETPVVIGWLKPVILLPPSLVSGLTISQVEAILAHELAHVRRHDYLVNLMQTAIETLLFYHPAVWWLSSRIRLERENCCDDMAIEVCGSRIDYAEALTAVEQGRHAPNLAMAVQGSSASQTLMRIRRILGVADRRSPSPSSLAAVLVVLLLSGTMLTSYVALADPPEKENQREVTLVKDYPLDGLTIAAGFEPDDASIVLGQPTFLTFTVTNRGNQPYSFVIGGDNRGSIRHNNFHITAVDEEGQAVKDPYSYDNFGGIAREITLEPGDTHTERLFLNHWLAFEQPGKYRVTCQRTLENYGSQPQFSKLAIQSEFPLEVLPYDRTKMQQAIDKLAVLIAQGKEDQLRDATIALASLDDPAVIPPLIKSAKQGDFLNKIPALEGLAKYSTKAATDALLLGLQDGDHAVRRAAANALRSAQKIDVATVALLQQLTSDSADLRASAARALGETKSESVLGPLANALNDPESAVRCAAAISLGQLGGTSEAALLKQQLSKEDRQLRVAAADGLRQMTPENKLDPTWLTPTIRETTDINDQTFHESMRLIRLYSGEEAAPALIGCLDFDDPSTKNTYNFFLILAIHHCKNGPDCYYRWKHDPNRAGTPDEIENNRNIFAELKAFAAGGFVNADKLIERAGIELNKGQTDAGKLPDLFEAVPAGSKSYEIRAEVIVLPRQSNQLDTTIYYVPTKDAYYIQRDPLGSSTMTFYGPFPGDPRKIVAADDKPNEKEEALPKATMRQPDSSTSKSNTQEPALVVRPRDANGKPVSQAYLTLWRALESGEPDPVNTVNGPGGFGYYDPVIWQDEINNARWVRVRNAHPNDGRHGWEGEAFHFDTLKPGRYRVTACTYRRQEKTPDPTPYGVSEPINYDVETAITTDIAMFPGDANLTLQLRDQETNRPISRMAIRLRDGSGMPIVHGHGSGNFFERTDEEGKVHFAHLKSGTFTVQVLGKQASVNQFVQYEPLERFLPIDIVPGDNRFDLAVAPRTLDQAEIDQRFPFSIFGRVTDPSGNPLSDVTVRAATGVGTLRGAGHTTTDSEGKYHLYFGPGMHMKVDKEHAPLGVGVQAAHFTAEKPGWELDADKGYLPYMMTDRKSEPFVAVGAEVDDTLQGAMTPELVIYPNNPRELNMVLKQVKE